MEASGAADPEVRCSAPPDEDAPDASGALQLRHEKAAGHQRTASLCIGPRESNTAAKAATGPAHRPRERPVAWASRRSTCIPPTYHPAAPEPPAHRIAPSRQDPSALSVMSRRRRRQIPRRCGRKPRRIQAQAHPDRGAPPASPLRARASAQERNPSPTGKAGRREGCLAFHPDPCVARGDLERPAGRRRTASAALRRSAPLRPANQTPGPRSPGAATGPVKGRLGAVR